MPNKRGKSQTLVAFPLDADLLSEMEEARGRKSRSQFVREALADKLRTMGYSISEDIVFPPDRTGKGGPKSKATQIGGRGNIQMTGNFTSPSDIAASAEGGKYQKPKRVRKKAGK